LLQKQFPNQDQTRISVVVSFPTGQPLSPDRIGALYDLSQMMTKLPNVLRVESPVNLDPNMRRADYQALYAGPRNALAPAVQEAVRQSIGEHIAVLSVVTARPAESEEARAIVRAIRAQSQVGDGQALVTGQTAFDLDFIGFIRGHTVIAASFVVLVTYVLLFLLTGSIVLPIKAVVTNLLSISASFGAMVWIFQQGHLSAQLNFTPASLGLVSTDARI